MRSLKTAVVVLLAAALLSVTHSSEDTLTGLTRIEVTAHTPGRPSVVEVKVVVDPVDPSRKIKSFEVLCDGETVAVPPQAVSDVSFPDLATLRVLYGGYATGEFPISLRVGYGAEVPQLRAPPRSLVLVVEGGVVVYRQLVNHSDSTFCCNGYTPSGKEFCEGIAPVCGLACADLPTMQALAGDDRAEIRYQVSGCFTELEYTIVVIGGESPHADIETVRQDYSIDLVVPKAQGRTELTDDDLAGLDRLVSYYRAQTGSGCTTTESVNIRWLRNGDVIKEEGYVDSSCDARNQPGALILPELLERVIEP